MVQVTTVTSVTSKCPAVQAECIAGFRVPCRKSKKMFPARTLSCSCLRPATAGLTTLAVLAPGVPDTTLRITILIFRSNMKIPMASTSLAFHYMMDKVYEDNTDKPKNKHI